MPKIILQNYISSIIIIIIVPFCSGFEIVSNFFHSYHFSTKLWLVKFSPAHLICKYLPQSSSFIVKLQIISTVRSSSIAKHIRENGKTN